MRFLKNIFAVITAVSALIVASYVGGIFYYSDKFLPNTYIDGTEVSSLTAQAADEKYKQEHYNVPITLSVKDNTFAVTDEYIDWSTFKGSQELINQLSFTDIGFALKNRTDYAMAVGDVPLGTAEKILKAWTIFTNVNAVKSQNAYVEYNNNGWVIVPEVQGTEINLENAKNIIRQIILFDRENEDLSNFDGFYIEAEIKQDDERIVSFRNRLDRATNKNITYSFNGEKYEITQKDLVPYTDFSNTAFTYIVNYDAFADEFVNNLASKVNTQGITRKFKTTLGDFVDIDGGNWGWSLDTKKTKELLLNQLTDENISVAEGKLEWIQTASENDGTDIRDYVEIDLSNQRLYMYKDNELLVATDITSGNPTHGNGTPGGIYHLSYKTRNTRLKGPTWNVAVKYWMPFNGGIGMHDASWRTDFGGDWYKINGSHGCVNMPTEAAKIVYDNIDSSYAIICFWRE